MTLFSSCRVQVDQGFQFTGAIWLQSTTLGRQSRVCNRVCNDGRTRDERHSIVGDVRPQRDSGRQVHEHHRNWSTLDRHSATTRRSHCAMYQEHRRVSWHKREPCGRKLVWCYGTELVRSNVDWKGHKIPIRRRAVLSWGLTGELRSCLGQCLPQLKLTRYINFLNTQWDWQILIGAIFDSDKHWFVSSSQKGLSKRGQVFYLCRRVAEDAPWCLCVVNVSISSTG